MPVTKTAMSLYDIDSAILSRLQILFGNTSYSAIMRMGLRDLYEKHIGPLSELEQEIEEHDSEQYTNTDNMQ